MFAMPRRRGCVGLPPRLGLQDEAARRQPERPLVRDGCTLRDEIHVGVGRERRPLGDEGLPHEDDTLVLLPTEMAQLGSCSAGAVARRCVGARQVVRNDDAHRLFF